SGGTGLPPGNPFYVDRLFINDGKGQFTLSEGALPFKNTCGSQVSAADFDKDGDLDLFVCGRVNLENYPNPPRSYLLRNDSKQQAKFTDITQEVNGELTNIGLLSSALWTDYDNDGWVDLMLAGEWMPLMVFKNNQGKLTNVTANSGLAGYTGWWNSLTAADFDKDGDTDYVAGNLGTNTRFKVSPSQPMRVIAKDFDADGYIDPICSYFVQGTEYPIYHRDVMISQIPTLQFKFAKYSDYAKATMEDIFSKEKKQGLYMADSKIFHTCYIENKGDGTFDVHPLPVEAQFAPVFGSLAGDYNDDGLGDILLVGNSWSSDVETGQYDAFIGLLLTGDGHGTFKSVPGRKSGFFVNGDAKGMAEMTSKSGSPVILVAQNAGALKVFENIRSQGTIIRVKGDDAFAVMDDGKGGKERREFYHGSGYLSGSSRVLHVPKGTVSVSIVKSNGESRKIETGAKD
ncbi:MAG: VCBS repeat-containing protein, partial [Cyclobacteriaceae bacterium]|nr:VCBS repeat-containing protein [Cyclobacteriaceae bacterium]